MRVHRESRPTTNGPVMVLVGPLPVETTMDVWPAVGVDMVAMRVAYSARLEEESNPVNMPGG